MAHACLETPSDWVVRWAPLVTHGPVLDVASGAGRHARFFAGRGMEVVAVDRDAQVIPGVTVSINKDAQPDKRSYRVSFEKFKQLAPGYVPEVDLPTAITELRDGLNAIGFDDENFRQSRFIRLNTLTQLKQEGLLSNDLEWTARSPLLRASA